MSKFVRILIAFEKLEGLKIQALTVLTFGSIGVFFRSHIPLLLLMCFLNFHSQIYIPPNACLWTLGPSHMILLSLNIDA